jgi:hypothetical protein
MWSTVKQWFFDVLSVRSSEISSIGYTKVNNWLNINSTLSPTSVDIPLDSESVLQQLVGPYNSASQKSEVISESSLQNVCVSNVVEPTIPQLIDPTQIPLPISDVSIASVYQIIDYTTYINLIALPDAKFFNLLIDGVRL